MPNLDIRRTLAYPNGDVHEVRAYLQGDATLVVEAAVAKISRRLGQPVSLGQAIELLCAEYLSTP